jgi:hypothetical protein
VASRVKVVVDEAALAQFVATNKPIRDLLVGVAKNVAQEAQSTAQSAQEGPGGTIYGYAEAGFSVVYEGRGGKRPRVNVVANADPKMALAAYFHTLKRDGVDHLRAALYKFTNRG